MGDYRTIATKRRGGGDTRGPAEADIKIAVAELEKELESPELVDQINLSINVVPPTDALVASREKVINSVVETRTPTLHQVIRTTPPLTMKIFLGSDLSERDAYVYQEATKPTEIIVTVNQNHPFWTTQLRGAEAVLEYLRQCTYDALAECHQRFPRIIELNGIEIESPLEGHLVIFANKDFPGAIGGIGTLLGKHGINIARFSLGREPNGAVKPGEKATFETACNAMAIVQTDSSVPNTVLEEIRSKVAAVMAAKSIYL